MIWTLLLLLAAQPFSGTVSGSVFGARRPVLQVRDTSGHTRQVTLPIQPAPRRRGSYEVALAQLKGRHLRVDRDGRAFLNGQDVALDLIERGLAQVDPTCTPSLAR